IYRNCGSAPARIIEEGSLEVSPVKQEIRQNEDVVLRSNATTSDKEIQIEIFELERKVYPNPLGGINTINIELYEKENCKRIWIFDSSGQKRYLHQWTKNGNVVNVQLPADLPSGFNLLMVGSGGKGLFSPFI